MFADFGFQLEEGFVIVFQELASVLTALSDTFPFVAIPGTRFFQQIVIYGKIKQIAFTRNSFAVHNIELSFSERGSDFVFHHFDFGA